MPGNLTDSYIANTYKGVLHVNGEELPEDEKVPVFDGAGNKTALSLGTSSADCLSLSAQGLSANNFKYPEEPGNLFDVVCQVTDNVDGSINILDVRNIQDIFCESNAGATYSRGNNANIPIPSTQCGIIKSISDERVTNITKAAGGVDLNEQNKRFLVTDAEIEGGIVKRLNFISITEPTNPNLLINAQGMINQRVIPNNGVVNQAWNPRGYFLDRWQLLNRSQRASYSFLNTNTNNNIVRFNATGGRAIRQTIEQRNIIPGTHILSWFGTATAVVTDTQGRSAVTQNISTSVPGLNIRRVQLVGGGDVRVTFTNGTVELPKLERGNVRTEFDYRNFGSELSLCQRYFCKTNNYNIVPGGGGGGIIVSHTDEPFIGFLHSNGWSFPVTMRTKPIAWPFAQGQINKVQYTRPGGDGEGIRALHPGFADSAGDARINGVRTDVPLLPRIMRIYSNHFVADAEF